MNLNTINQFFKITVLIVVLSVCFMKVYGQRRIVLRTFGKDTIAAAVSSDYYLIEDSCAQIVRYSRYDRQNKRFVGKFKDVRKDDTTKILAEGNYNDDGQKDGDFYSYYLNGTLQAKGSFAKDKYVGGWTFYHEDGTPELIFSVVNGNTVLTDAWDEKDKKIVDKGRGKFKFVPVQSRRYWMGRLVKGRPDGDWSMYDVNDPDKIEVITEHWDNGKFLSGGNNAQTYTDTSHMQLVDTRKLSLTNAEALMFSPQPCDVVRLSQHYTAAKYAPGDKKLFDYFDQLTNDYVDHFYKNRKAFALIGEYILILGELDGTGHLVNLTSPVKSRSTDYMIDLLKRYIPQFTPATAYDKPIRQGIVFHFKFGNNEVKYDYQLQPIQIKE